MDEDFTDAVCIPLLRGKHTIIDSEDYERFKSVAMCLVSTGYVLCSLGKHGGQQLLHRVLVGARKGEYVDHINRNRVDNRRVNLRICTQTQNNMNSPGHKGRKSKYKGVTLAPCGKWRAYIKANGKQVWLGSYSSEEEAAGAYNRAAAEVYGHFAYLNDCSIARHAHN